jgi:hypothetical protein
MVAALNDEKRDIGLTRKNSLRRSWFIEANFAAAALIRSKFRRWG